ncbi:MAG TPA: hypothetical protein VLC98_12185 [Phnomibacter sp.]|nr:hypothetical protein [Phnomibacter sp.]
MPAIINTSHLILISDGIPTPSGAGISQTLANLLDAYPGSITCICTADENTEAYADRLPAGIARYETGPWKSWSNRIGALLNTYFAGKQMQWMMDNPLALTGLPSPGDSLVMVSTTVAHKLLVAWQLLQQGYTVVPYFMDDWMAGNTLQWQHKKQRYSIQKIVKELLSHAPAWLMISEELQNTLSKRYQLQPKPCLVVHNPAKPVDDAEWQQEPTGIHNKDSYPIVYAGSIWPMHAEALIAVAAAVHLLHSKGMAGFELHVYANPSHWAQYQKMLGGPGVQYMGWKPYAEIHQWLQQGWLLLCTASFEEAHLSFSRSSVQTKLTDYMTVRKPILFVGPAESASGRFVETWDCGFTISTNNAADIAERLQAITRMPQQYLRKSINAGIEASTTFSKAEVQQKLYAFLEKI